MAKATSKRTGAPKASRRAALAMAAVLVRPRASVAEEAVRAREAQGRLASEGDDETYVLVATEAATSLNAQQQKQLDNNKRIQYQNGVQGDFPGFVREGYNVTVVVDDSYCVAPSGLIYDEIRAGEAATDKNDLQRRD
eukprot:jgi/Pico_ML_1/51563/g2566.t1